tara:strand:- start:407 stop:1672 length:1266 start_codon:yes stop_codon:yes gene_type:complete
MTQLLEVLRPQSWEAFVGNKLAVSKVKSWSPRRGILVVSGPEGVGKSTLAVLRLQALGCEPLILDASQTINFATVEQHVRLSRFGKPLDGSRPIGLVWEDIEGGYVKHNDIKKLHNQFPYCPMIVTCRDLTCESVRKFAKSINIDNQVVLCAVCRQELQSVLVRACKHLRAKLSHDQVKHIHSAANGDIRKALTMVELESRGSQTVTSCSDGRRTLSRTTEADALAELLGVSSCTSKHDRANTLELDSFKLTNRIFDSGIELCHSHGHNDSMHGWSRVCDDLALADLFERSSAHPEGNVLVASTVPVHKQMLWKRQPSQLKGSPPMPSMIKLLIDQAAHRRILNAFKPVHPCDMNLTIRAIQGTQNPTILLQILLQHASLTAMEVDKILSMCNLSKTARNTFKTHLAEKTTQNNMKRRKKK